ncbi:MAG: glycosyltransferase family 4 protein [Enhydrobacter sp.]|nr:MAG: glycosyltransferase family 4 protein [Enhydrobacter sp.]
MDVSPALEGRVLARAPRFDRIAVSSVFGDARLAGTWSGAPSNVASALERLGVKVATLMPQLGRWDKARIALMQLARGHGRPLSGEQILRSLDARRLHARQAAGQAAALGVTRVLHFGTFDLPAVDGDRVEHYLYCDHTWDLSRRHHVHADRYTARALADFEEAECLALHDLAHVFTFGAYVRDNLIVHYGLQPDRVTAVGSGFGGIEPFTGAKDYGRPRLLFVAKHLFREKGGVLLLEAFARLRRERRDVVLTIVGDERSRRFVGSADGVDFRAHLPWRELQRLYRDSTLLVQPMLNDPWGQVYLEAMASRTPVMGLARNGLPELTDGGRHGFLVDRADADSLARAMLCALSDPARLERMAIAGQRYVLGTHSWDRVAERMVFP